MKCLWIVLFAFAVSACGTSPDEDAPQRASAMVGVVNHTDRFIYSASVDGAGGDAMDEYSAGGASVCCTTIPVKWYPGMKVTVRWNMPIGRQYVVKEKVVEVERYDEPASIYLHFFPNDVVRVIVTDYGGSSTKHPIPAPVKPAGWKRKE